MTSFTIPDFAQESEDPAKDNLQFLREIEGVVTHRSTIKDLTTYDPLATVTVGENMTSRVLATITSLAAAASNSLAQMH